MARVEAALDLLAPPADVWAFVAEPHHLADWWPGLSAVQPDRRGLASGARWQLRRADEPTLLRASRSTELLLVRDVDPPRLAAWHLAGDRLDVELRLAPAGPDATTATLVVSGRWLVGARRSLARRALRRLYDLCQTAAEL